jgi:hypothetical protein
MASSPGGRGEGRGRRAHWGRKGFDPPGNLGDGGGFRSAGESGIEEGGVPTRAEAGTGLEVAAVGLVEEGGAARRDGAEA